MTGTSKRMKGWKGDKAKNKETKRGISQEMMDEVSDFCQCQGERAQVVTNQHYDLVAPNTALGKDTLH